MSMGTGVTNKRPGLIQLCEVDDVFSRSEIERLADEVRLPRDANVDQFGADIRAAVRDFLGNAAVPSSNMQRRMIAKLHRLASQSMYEELAQVLETLPPAVRNLLGSRAKFIQNSRQGHTQSFAGVAMDRQAWAVPDAEDFRKSETCEQATQILLRLIETGGQIQDGRTRSNGRRSRGWQPVLHAPTASRKEPRRDAERKLVQKLQLALFTVAGEVSLTAHHDKPGPFARFVGEILILVGTTGKATAVGLAVQLINDLDRIGKTQAARSEKLRETLSGMNS